MGQVIEDSPVEAGHGAIARHEWKQAFDLFKQADGHMSLSADDLHALSTAAWWTGQIEEAIEARERAYAAYLGEDRPRPAAMVALWLSIDYAGRLAHSIAQGWYSRAERLLAKEEDCPELGYLAWTRAQGFFAVGDNEAALEQAEFVIGLASRFGDRDLLAYGLLDKGRALVNKGSVEEGIALLDEATVAAVSGELGPLAAGIVYCHAITTTTQLADYGRAGQWTEAAKRWCERQSISGFPGVCRVHRAEIIRLRGAWVEAEQEARRALAELQNFNLEMAGEGFYEIGEIRLRMGDLDEARKAFHQANELGRAPEPGLSMLKLAEGKAAAAHSSIKRALADDSRDTLSRSRLLPAQVEIAIAAGDHDTAAAAIEELDALSRSFGTPPLQAAALCARAELQLARGEAAAAVSNLRKSWRLWTRSDLPYEAARTRMLLGVALRADGDDDGAELEIKAAKSAFERLGAVLDLRRALELLGEDVAGGLPKASIPGETTVKTFMFTDIVRSTNLVDAIGDKAWEQLLDWHDQALRKCFMEHSGAEINKIGDGFFVAFDTTWEAVECAVQIQRKLCDHRKQHGFAPDVRIGLHTTEAIQKGRDYGGKGVHTAARVGALAQGGEILVTRDVLEGVQLRFPISEVRTVELKGVTEPVEVATIEALAG